MSAVPDAWLAAHGVHRRWVVSVLASWAALGLCATVSVPLKYPFAARAEVVDSGVVIGLLVPLVISGLVLDEGPPDLLAGASRSLSSGRVALASVYLAASWAGAAAVASVVGLPVTLIALDGLAAGALVVLGVALCGPRIGWIPAAAVAVVVSTPGLVPWEWNVAYQRDVAMSYACVVSALLLVAAGAYARFGSNGVLSGRR